MKKIWLVITILTLISLFVATTQVLASPVSLIDPKKTPNHTPGAQATTRAEEKATQGVGNPHDVGKQHGKRLNYRGAIAAADAASLTLTLDDASSLTFIITVDTRINIPTLGGSATAADLLVGLKATVQAAQDDAGGLTAIKIQVVPGKPVRIHHVGTVTAYLPGTSITIVAQDGNLYSFLLTEETKILPVERVELLVIGARVTIIAPRDVATGAFTAAGIVVHPAGSGGPTPEMSTMTATATPTDTPTP